MNSESNAWQLESIIDLQIENVHGLEILDNNLYITNQRNGSLVTMDRFDNPTKPKRFIRRDVPHPEAVFVVHRQRQPTGRQGGGQPTQPFATTGATDRYGQPQGGTPNPNRREQQPTGREGQPLGTTRLREEQPGETTDKQRQATEARVTSAQHPNKNKPSSNPQGNFNPVQLRGITADSVQSRSKAEAN